MRSRLLAACLGLLVGCTAAVRAPAPADPAAPATSATTPAPPAPTVPEPGLDAPSAPASVEPAVSASGSTMAPALAGDSTTATTAIPAMGHGRDVFDRIRRGLSPGACDTGPNGARWRKRFAGHPAVFARHLEQVLPLMDFVSIEVERSGLPAEFVFIPLVESGYRPEAVSSGGPAGMWQMIGSTARNHGIHIRAGYDGRQSPVESTRAALSYLKTLQGMFGGDWQAMVMAYNAGEGRMQAAFKRARSREVSAARRRPHGLANVTYDYVGKLQALACLVAEPGRAGLSLPTGARFVPLAPLLAGASVDSLEEFARQQGVSAADLRRLNPGFKGGRIVAGVPRLVLTPTLGRQAAAPPGDAEPVVAGVDDPAADAPPTKP